jgi:hypothetical protein
MWEITVRCDCGYIIRLPAAKPPQRVLDQLRLTTGGLPTNVLCPHCNRVSAYSPDKFQRAFFRKTPLSQFRADQVCACIQVRCGVGDCAALVHIRAAMGVSEDMHEAVLDLSDRAMLINAVCEKGHLVNGRVLGGLYDVLVDPGWESLGWESLDEKPK